MLFNDSIKYFITELTGGTDWALINVQSCKRQWRKLRSEIGAHLPMKDTPVDSEPLL